MIIQDRVPAFSPEKAKALIQSELGSPVEVLFKEFEDLPIGAANLGQVLLGVVLKISFFLMIKTMF